MYHLYTEIKGTLLNHSYISLIDELHPTPALGGYPKKAVDYIEKMSLVHEDYMGLQLDISM